MRCLLLVKDSHNVKIRCRYQKDFSQQKCSNTTACNVVLEESNLSKSSNLNSNPMQSQRSFSIYCLMNMAPRVLSALCLAATLTSLRLLKVSRNEAVANDCSHNHHLGIRPMRNRIQVIRSKGPHFKLTDKHPSNNTSHS